MNQQMLFARNIVQLRKGTMLFGVTVLLGWGSLAFGYGGKRHAESFTALQALQKATDLYDQLIIKGKLDEL